MNPLGQIELWVLVAPHYGILDAMFLPVPVDCVGVPDVDEEEYRNKKNDITKGTIHYNNAHLDLEGFSWKDVKNNDDKIYTFKNQKAVEFQMFSFSKCT